MCWASLTFLGWATLSADAPLECLEEGSSGLVIPTRQTVILLTGHAVVGVATALSLDLEKLFAGCALLPEWLRRLICWRIVQYTRGRRRALLGSHLPTNTRRLFRAEATAEKAIKLVINLELVNLENILQFYW